jgi:hypothetical protein
MAIAMMPPISGTVRYISVYKFGGDVRRLAALSATYWL